MATLNNVNVVGSLFMFKVDFDHAQTKQKALLLIQDRVTRWNSTCLMLERLKKLKSMVRYYLANFKNDQDSNITPEEWQLVNDIILLFEPFFCIKGV